MKDVIRQPVTPEVQAIARKAIALFADERAEDAFTTLQKGVEQHNHARLWRLMARLRLFFGDEESAVEILQNVLPVSWSPGFWELAQAGSAQGYAVKSEKHKLLYFPIRKCACTSMYNFMSILDGGTEQGEEIHSDQAHTLVKLGSLKEEYPDYKAIAVVRNPIERVRSFYHGNILKRDHLVRDTGGKKTFYGLATKPTYQEFLSNFDAYRRTFITVRNHTDEITSFIGKKVSDYDFIVPVRNLSELKQKLTEDTGIELPDLHDMKSGMNNPEETQAEQALKKFYKTDYEIYGSYF